MKQSWVTSFFFCCTLFDDMMNVLFLILFL